MREQTLVRCVDHLAERVHQKWWLICSDSLVVYRGMLLINSASVDVSDSVYMLGRVAPGARPRWLLVIAGVLICAEFITRGVGGMSEILPRLVLQCRISDADKILVAALAAG